MFPRGGFAAVTEITLEDFVNPTVIDFESVPAGPISGTDPIFTAAGIAAVSLVIGEVAPGDVYDAHLDGNGLSSINRELAILAPGDPIDFAVAPGNPSNPTFTFTFQRKQFRFGVSVTDQFNHFMTLTFIDDGTTVGSFTFTTAINDIQPLSESTVHLQSSIAFNEVSISGGGGYGLDNLALDVIPEPATVWLVVAGLSGCLCLRARKASRPPTTR